MARQYSHRKKRFALGASVIALMGAGHAVAQTSPTCVAADDGICVIILDGANTTITLAPPVRLVNRGTIAGNEGVVVSAPAATPGGVPTAIASIIENRSGATIAGTGGTAIRGAGPLAVVNAGVINGNVQGAQYYVANGGTLNGNLVLGTGASSDFGTAYFLQRGATTGVTGSINAGNGIDFWIRSYDATTAVTLGGALPTSFEVEGVEARGTGTTVTTGAASSTAIGGLMLMGDGNVVNRANINTFALNGANFPTGAALFTPAIGYAGIPEQNRMMTLRFVNPGNPNQTLATYSQIAGAALTGFTNEGTVNGDIRLPTAGFVNTGTINLVSRATGSMIVTAPDKDFVFRNTGTVTYTDTGARAGLAQTEAQYLGDGDAGAALRIYTLTAKDAKAATFDNSGRLSGGLTGKLVAKTIAFTNTGSIAGIEGGNVAASGVSLTVGNTVLDTERTNTVVADSLSFLNGADGRIGNGVRIDAAAQDLAFENRGAITGGSDNRALSIDQFGKTDANGDDVDTARFGFINSGSITGDVVLGTNALATTIVNSGTVTMPLQRAFEPYAIKEALEIEVDTGGANRIDFTNSGAIVQNNLGATGVSFEVESRAGSTIDIVNTGVIRSDGGAKRVPAQFAGQPDGKQLAVPSIGLFVGVDAPQSTVRIDNREGATISAYGPDTNHTPTQTGPGTAGLPGLFSIAVLTNTGETGTTEIVNAGTIVGGPSFATPSQVRNYDAPIDPTNNAAGGAITGGASRDTVINTATGRITGAIALGAGDDRVENYGSIEGRVDLGAGNDTYLHLVKNIQSAFVDGGAGDDTLLFDITGSDGIVSDDLLASFVNFEIRKLVGTGSVVTNSEVQVDATAPLTLAAGSNIDRPGETAVSGGSGSETVSNAGTITGNIDLGGGDNSFSNSGTVVGNVTTGTGADVFTNTGSVTGTVDLGAGGDRYVVGRAVNGTVDGGSGFDEIVFDLSTRAGGASRAADTSLRAASFSRQSTVGDGTTAFVQAAASSSATDAAIALNPEVIGDVVNFELLSVNGPGVVVASGDLTVNTVGLNGATLRVDAGSSFGTAGATTITGSSGVETVTIDGTLKGGVALGVGADILNVAGRIGGAVDLGDGDDRLNIGAGASFAGIVSGGGGTDAIVVAAGGSATAPFELAGSFSGFERYSQAGGVTAISGEMSLGSGNTFAVNGGSLYGRALSVLTGNVDVASGATFGTAGTVNGNINIASGATLAPGASPGVMTVNGNVNLASGSTTTFEFVPSPGQSDQLNVNGALAIASGTTLNMTGNRPLTPGVTYNMITASGGITGTFTTVNKASGVLGFLRYTPNQLQLLGTFVVPTDAGAQTGRAVDYVNSVLIAGTASSGLLGAVPSLLNADGTANADVFARLTPEAYASASQLSVEHGLTLARTARSGLVATRADRAGPFVFAQGIGNSRTLNGDAATGTARTRTDTVGFVGGVGYGNETASVGAFVGKLDSHQTLYSRGVRTDADGLVAGIAGRFGTGVFDGNVLIAYDWSQADTSRALPGTTARGSYDLHALTLDVAVGALLTVSPGWALRPEVGVTHVATDRAGTVESGNAAFGYTVAGARPKATFIDASLMLKGGLDGAAVQPWVQAGIRHQIDGRRITASGNFAGSTSFEATGAWREPVVGLAAIGVTARLGERTTLYSSYMGEFGDTSRHNMTVGVRFDF